MSRYADFFATKQDSLDLLLRLEGGSPLLYVRWGHYDSPAAPTYETARDIPDLGSLRYGRKGDNRYLVLPTRAALKFYKHKRPGGPEYEPQPRRYSPYVFFHGGGLYRDGFLITGEVWTAFETREAVRFFDRFYRAIRAVHPGRRAHRPRQPLRPGGPGAAAGPPGPVHRRHRMPAGDGPEATARLASRRTRRRTGPRRDHGVATFKPPAPPRRVSFMVGGGGLQVAEGAGEELDHAGLLRPFLAGRWRSRYDSVRPGTARRSELFNKLCHRYAEVLDWRYARPAGGAPEQELRRLGAAAKCYCLCGPDELDGREAPLAGALGALSGRGLPVLLVCRPGVLAYFEPEHEGGVGRRYILQRPDADPSAAADRGGM
jgi:hypothetical protein